MRLYDLFWNVNIFARCLDPLPLLLFLPMAMRGSQIEDNGDHRDGFIVQSESVSLSENNLRRRCDHKD